MLITQRDAKEAEGTPPEDLVRIRTAAGLRILPHWLAQPYFRPPPITTNREIGKLPYTVLSANYLAHSTFLEPVMVVKRPHSERTPEGPSDEPKRARLEANIAST